jgi:hypothetical protein
VNDIWTNENQTGTLPGVADDLYTGNNPSGATDFLLEDASFLRIKNIMLGYSLPVKEKRLIQNARFFINLDNVGLFTKYNGYDPEISELNPYPQAFTTTLGVNVVF